jgi:prepilin-type processing-associated H-X9-DG protein
MKLPRANNRNRALTSKDVLVVTFVAAAILLWLSLQPRHHVGSKAIRINCASNLQYIGLAFRNWEEDNHTDHFPMRGFTNQLGIMEYPKPSNMFRYFQVMSNELINPKVLICPADKRTDADSFALLSNTNISYFVAQDADESYPSMPLARDRNLVVDGVVAEAGLLTVNAANQIGWHKTIHGGLGNVLMADGSVQQASSSYLQQLIAHSGTNVNRLAVP